MSSECQMVLTPGARHLPGVPFALPPHRRRALARYARQGGVLATIFSVLIQVAGLCLCAPVSAADCEPMGCCPKAVSHGQGHDHAAATPSSSVSPATACCSSQVMTVAPARTDGRTASAVVLAPAAVDAQWPEPGSASLASVLSAVTQRDTSPPRTPILRI